MYKNVFTFFKKFFFTAQNFNFMLVMNIKFFLNIYYSNIYVYTHLFNLSVKKISFFFKNSFTILGFVGLLYIIVLV